MVARLAVGDTGIKPQLDVFAPPKESRAPLRAWPRYPRDERTADDLPFDSTGGISIRYQFPVDAEYVFRIKMPAPAPRWSRDTCAPVGQVFLELRVPRESGRAPGGPDVPAVGHDFRGGADDRWIGHRGNPPGAGAPAGKDTPLAAHNHMDLRLDGARLKLYDVPDGSFTEIAIGGPYKTAGAGDTPSRRMIFVCEPVSAKEEEPCARSILSSLTPRAYRRPVTETDLSPLLALYRTGRKQGTFEDGVEMALRAVLVSPDFLFRIERDPPKSAPGSVYRISDFELASRLSYFLWSSMPDEELLKLAGQGKLKDPAVIGPQVSRMLDDGRSKAFVNNFAGQYLYLRNLASLRPDPDVYPQYDAYLPSALL